MESDWSKNREGLIDVIQNKFPDILENPFPETPDIDPPTKKKKKRKHAPSQKQEPKPFPSKYPFRILGVSDDGIACYVGIENRLHDIPLSKLSKQFLINALAPHDWWIDNFGYENKIHWDRVVSDMAGLTAASDFDPGDVRGRGAWRECDGRLCYHDGQDTIGEWSKRRLYLRKTKKDIGLSNSHTSPNVRREIIENLKQMSFATGTDRVRTVGWLTLAPFCGALPWRPAMLLTGASRSGKSTVVNYLVEKIALPLTVTGGTTEAAIRQAIKNDARPIVIEESEKDTDKKRKITADLFALMRASTSDNAPPILKGTTDGRGMSFRCHNMFLFVAIDPTVENFADENRVFRVNMVKPSETQIENWRAIEQNIVNLTTPKNCAGIRSLTWSKLPEILEYAKYLEPIIRAESGRDIRFAYAEGLLLAAYWLIWMNARPEGDDARLGVASLYEMAALDVERNETQEIIDRILDESIRVELQGGDANKREVLTLRQILNAVHTRELHGDRIIDSGIITYLRNLAGQYGVGITKDGFLAIANNHHEIQKIIHMGSGYQRVLYRHDGLVEKNYGVRIAGNTKKCVILKGVLEVSDDQ